MDVLFSEKTRIGILCESSAFLADDSHEMSRLIFPGKAEDSQKISSLIFSGNTKLSSAAVVISALRVNQHTCP